MLLAEGKDGKLGPRLQQFDALKTVTDLAMEGHNDGKFTKTEAQSFMQDFGISQHECDTQFSPNLAQHCHCQHLLLRSYNIDMKSC